MIEVRVDLDDLRKVTHEVLYNIALIERMRKAGIPVVGRLIPSAVTHGTVIWTVDEDLDGDTLVIRWYERDEVSIYYTTTEDEL